MPNAEGCDDLGGTGRLSPPKKSQAVKRRNVVNFISRFIALGMIASAFSPLIAQQARIGVLGADDLKKALPKDYFFRGQSAPVQLRNSAGIRSQADKLVLAALVDNSGYAADLQAKYQGLLITEVKLDIEGSSLSPGEYGFGFTKDGKFVVMDVGASDLLSASVKIDNSLQRPVPLKIVENGGAYRLYAGKKWVEIKIQ
jgi:hypothetical protein